MASEKVQSILESIQSLTLLEAAELSKAMEEAFFDEESQKMLDERVKKRVEDIKLQYCRC